MDSTARAPETAPATEPVGTVSGRLTSPDARAAAQGPSWLRSILRVSVLYTAVTVVSSVLALATGHTTDTHVHLLMRLGFVVVGIGAVDLYDLMRSRSRAGKWVAGVTAYLVGVVVVMSGMWLWGATGGDLHPDAFRDGFLNFTGVGVVVALVIGLADAIRQRRGSRQRAT